MNTIAPKQSKLFIPQKLNWAIVACTLSFLAYYFDAKHALVPTGALLLLTMSCLFDRLPEHQPGTCRVAVAIKGLLLSLTWLFVGAMCGLAGNLGAHAVDIHTTHQPLWFINLFFGVVSPVLIVMGTIMATAYLLVLCSQGIRVACRLVTNK